jgi:hypothetical protein
VNDFKTFTGLLICKVLRLSAFVFILLSTASSIIAQETITLPLTRRAKDGLTDKSQIILPLFIVESNQLELYDPLKKPASVKFTVKFPDMKGCTDTAYGFIYFTGFGEAVNKGNTVILVGNYKGPRPPKIFVDYNNNLDLGDDGPGIDFNLQDKWIDIAIPNKSNTMGTYVQRLSRPDFKGKETSYKMMTEHFEKYSGSRKFAGLTHSFREQRINMVAGDYRAGADSFSIALQDGDINGLFNDSETDRLVIGPYNTQIFNTEDQNSVIPLTGKQIVFERNRQVFEVVEIDAAGKFVRFRRSGQELLSKQYAEGEKLPKVKFALHNGTKTSLKKYRRKPVYLFFWNSSYEGFEKDTLIFRRIMDKYGKRITIIALNYGDTPRDIANIAEYGRATWVNGASNADINRQLFIGDLPQGYLLKKKLKFEKALQPAELEILLQQRY